MPNMGINYKRDQNNLVQIIIRGRNHTTIKIIMEKDEVLECIINSSKYRSHLNSSKYCSHLSSTAQEGNFKPVTQNLIYSANELKALRETVLHNRQFRTLPLVVVNNIRKINLHKKRREKKRTTENEKKTRSKIADISNLFNIKT